MKINCKWCNKELTASQKYSFLRGKQKQTCSKSCGVKLGLHGSIDNYTLKNTIKCKNCKKSFLNEKDYKKETCSKKCTYELSSKRMVKDNPMKNEVTRKKVSIKLKEIKHKPYIQGGNGRGATISQLLLYNELIKKNDSFQMELIELTRGFTEEYKCPNHYKLDIASRMLNIAIEVDGSSHYSLKVKECDKRKEKVLRLKGWKVLRFTNSQIQKELKNCVQMVMSTI